MLPNITLQQHCTHMESDIETPVSLFLHHATNNNGILFESADGNGKWGRYSILALDFLLYAQCVNGTMLITAMENTLQPLTQLNGVPFAYGLRQLQKALTIVPDTNLAPLPPITRGLYGLLDYNTAGLFDPLYANDLPAQTAGAYLALPNTVLLFDHQYNQLTKLSLGKQPILQSVVQQGNITEGTPSLGVISTSVTQEQFNQQVSTITTAIAQGELYQAMLSVGFSASFSGDLFAVYRKLRQINPSPYMYFMQLPQFTLLGSSPEVLVSCTNGNLAICPIAGTRLRGNSAETDTIFSEELLTNQQEQAEHVMYVDSCRNDLSRIATIGSVTVEKYMEVQQFSHVMHLRSRIEAVLAKPKDAVDVLEAVFPSGTVTGTPKHNAVTILAKLEQQPRGPFAGAVGWLGLDNNAMHMDFGIVMRSAWHQNGTLHWQEAVNITQNAEPQTEWTECMTKAAIIQKALEAYMATASNK